MPASCAMAGRCSAALVEPPVAATTMAAFSNALRVTMSRGRMPSARSRITALAALDGIGVAALVRRGRAGRARQRETDRLRHAGHGVGRELAAAGAGAGAGDALELVQLFVTSSCPAECMPTPSKTSTTVTSRPWNFPGRIEPPYMNTDGTFRRSMAIIVPGRLLSQPAMPTIAS